ncbi:MAG TPA: hypothetical protein VFU23_07345 [Gemmatimonadales bacterium]|nr:hypothetical protein [Gemmatimonadales bacterium]
MTAQLQRYTYAPEGDGTTLDQAIVERALHGTIRGEDDALNCTQAAAVAQDAFAAQNPPVNTEVVVADGHAVLRMPDGRYYDPSLAMQGKDPWVNEAPYQGVDGVTVQERKEIAASARAAASALPPGATSPQRDAAALSAADATARRMGKDGAAGEISATTQANDSAHAEASADLDEVLMASGGSDEFIASQSAVVLDEHRDDPEYVAAYVAELKERGLLERVIGWAFAPQDGQMSRANDAQQSALVSAMDTARAAGVVSDQELRAYAAGPSGAGFVALNARSANPVTQVGGAAGDPAVTSVQQAKDAYDDAHSDVLGADAQLQAELDAMPNGLTPEQREAYIAEYRERHHEVYDREAQAAADLATALQDPALADAAIRDPAAAKLIFESQEALSSTGQAVSTLKWMDGIADPNTELYKAYAAAVPDFEQRLGKMAEQAIPAAAGQLMVQNGGDPQAALDELANLVGPLQGMVTLASSPEDWNKVWNAVRTGADGNYVALRALASDFSTMSPLAKGLTSAGLMFGALAVTTNAMQGEFTQTMAAFAQLGSEGIEVIGDSIRGYAESGKLAKWLGETNADAAMGFARWSERFAPGLGLLASTAVTVADFQSLKDDPTVGKALMVVGDAVTVLGSALDTIPGGQLAGEFFVLGGSIVSAIGSVIDWVQTGNDTRDEMRGILTSDRLKAAGFNQGAADAFTSRGQDLDALSAAGLTPEQVQQFAAEHGYLVGTGNYLEAVAKAAQVLGIQGQEFLDWVNSLGDDGEIQDLGSIWLDAFTREASGGSPVTPEELLAPLDEDSRAYAG